MKRIQILFIATSSNASPARGGRRRIVDVARQVTKFGISSVILCFLPFEQVSRGIKFWRSGKKSLADEAEVKVYYWPMIPLTRYKLLNALNNLYCGFVTAVFCKLFNNNIIYGHGIKAGYIGIKASQFNKQCKVITDVHGASSAEFRYNKSESIKEQNYQAVETIERFVIEKTDQLIFVSSRMQEYYKNKLNYKISNYQVIPCATNADFTINAEKRIGDRVKHGLENKLVFVYSGSAVDYQLPEKMCLIFKNIRNVFPDAYLLILTHQGQIFKRYLDQYGVSESDYGIYAVDHTRVFEFLQMGDIGFMLRDDSIVNKVASPTKFAEYLLSGLPVITSAYVGDFFQIVQKYQLGQVISLSEKAVSPELLAFIKDVQAQRENYAKRCAAYAKRNLTWDIYGDDLFKIFNKLVGKQPMSSAN